MRLKLHSDGAALIVLHGEQKPELWTDSETRRIRRWCATCECYALVAHSEIVGTIMFEQDGNIHLSRLPSDQRKPVSRTDFIPIMQLVNYGLDKFGTLKARIRPQRPHMIRIAKRVGFKTDSETPEFVYMSLVKPDFKFKDV